jgi:hypothetical protein
MAPDLPVLYYANYYTSTTITLHQTAEQLDLTMHQALAMFLEPFKMDMQHDPDATWPPLDRIPPASGGHDAISLEERLRRMAISDSEESTVVLDCVSFEGSGTDIYKELGPTALWKQLLGCCVGKR